jgi:hypothetical protein
MIDPDRACPHEDFQVDCDMNRITGDGGGSPIAFSLDVRVRCLQCAEVFRFTGMPAGLSPSGPHCSPDETEARLPMRPASSDPDFGLGLPGFSIRVRE